MSLDENRGCGGRRTRMATRRSHPSISMPMTTEREYHDPYCDEDLDLMNQYGDPHADADRWGPGLRTRMLQRRPPSPRWPLAARDVHRGPDIVQIPSDDDEILEYTRSTLEYSPIIEDYTSSTPSVESTTRFCPREPSGNHH